ncbi:MAG: hypothetical protein R3Y64_08005 [Peptostreptococcaceae bacterium]
MNSIIGDIDYILSKDDKEQKEFKLLCVELSKAHSLCASTQKGKESLLEVSFYK